MVAQPGLTQEETDYVEKALASAQLSMKEILMVMLIADLTEKPVMDVQSKFMDKAIGVQNVFKALK